jgi:hypothetical protein
MPSRPLTVHPCHVARASDGWDALTVHARGPALLLGLGRPRRIGATWDATVLLAGLPDVFGVWLLGRHGIQRVRVHMPPRLTVSIPAPPRVRLPRNPAPLVLPRDTVEVPSVSPAVTPLPPTVP